MPANPGKKQPEGGRGQNRAQRIALLQDAGKCAAALFGQGLEGQRRAHAPLAAHGDAEESAQDQKCVQRRRKGAGQLDHREAENIHDQHRPAAVTVGQHAKKQRAHGPECLCQKHRAQHRRRLGMELAGNRLHAKDQQKEVETVERPAQKRGHKGVALGTGERLKLAENGHRREDSRTRSPLSRRNADLARKARNAGGIRQLQAQAWGTKTSRSPAAQGRKSLIASLFLLRDLRNSVKRPKIAKYLLRRLSCQAHLKFGWDSKAFALRGCPFPGAAFPRHSAAVAVPALKKRSIPP